jgi:hypothetical protein
LRILAEHLIKPWRYQSWIFRRDPGFAAKSTVILGLYQGYYRGKRLRPGDRVVCVDAKPPIQARARCHATASPRRGALADLGRCAATAGHTTPRELRPCCGRHTHH